MNTLNRSWIFCFCCCGTDSQCIYVDVVHYMKADKCVLADCAAAPCRIIHDSVHALTQREQLTFVCIWVTHAKFPRKLKENTSKNKIEKMLEQKQVRYDCECWTWWSCVNGTECVGWANRYMKIHFYFSILRIDLKSFYFEISCLECREYR